MLINILLALVVGYFVAPWVIKFIKIFKDYFDGK